MINSRLRREGAFPPSLELTIISLSRAPSWLLEWKQLGAPDCSPGSKSSVNPMGVAGPRIEGSWWWWLRGQEYELQVPPGIKWAECRWGSHIKCHFCSQLLTADAQVHKGLEIPREPCAWSVECALSTQSGSKTYIYL